MKYKKHVVFFAVAGVLALLLCTPVAVLAGAGHCSGVPEGCKTVGPQVKGTIMVGWKPILESPGYGTVEAYLVVDGKSYADILDSENPENEFLATTAADVTTWYLPNELADEYNLPDVTGVMVLNENDVTTDVNIVDLGYYNTYKYILSCEVKITFIAPANKQ